MSEVIEFSLDRKDFLESGLNFEIENIEESSSFAYSSALYSAASRATDPKKAEIFRLLALLMTDPLRLDTPNSPLADADRFSDHHLTFFENILADVSDEEIAARIADLLWIRKKDYKKAEVAIDLYLKCSSEINLANWTQTSNQIERALQLASSINRNGDQYCKVVNRIIEILDKFGSEAPLDLSAKLMRLLLERGEGDSKMYSQLSETLAIKAESEYEFERARTYWDAKVAWHQREREETAVKDARTKIAESYEKQSDYNLANRQPKYLMAAHALEQAIVAYRRVSGSHAKIDEIKLKLREYQALAVQEMPLINSDSVDITDIYLQAENAVRDKSFHEALRILVSLPSNSNVGEIRAQVEENKKTYLLKSLFPTVLMSPNGRVIARQPEDEEEALIADICDYIGHTYLISGKGIIEPARNIILSQHAVRVNDLLELLQNHPYIPDGREYIVAQGLQSGLTGDFLTATHLLIPQMEECFRYLLISLGVVPSSFTDNGIQDEYNLNKILRETKFTDKLHQIFGEDFIFDLRCVLVERFGSNLRNDMAHGLLEHNAFYSSAVVYFWWLSLRFWLAPVFIEPSGTPPEDSGKSSDDDSEQIMERGM